MELYLWPLLSGIKVMLFDRVFNTFVASNRGKQEVIQSESIPNMQ